MGVQIQIAVMEGGVQDPEIVVGNAEERHPENSNKDGIRTYSFRKTLELAVYTKLSLS